jgi:hypothetical protein
MHFAIEVGEQFKQQVEFHFNQLLGKTVIRANGREVKKNVRLIDEPIFDTHELDLEGPEKVRVRIEKRRKQLLASSYLVYVNDRLQQSYQGI